MEAFRIVIQLDWTQEYRERGFVLLDRVFTDRSIGEMERSIESAGTSSSAITRRGSIFGLRNLFSVVPALQTFVRSAEIRRIVDPILGQEARAIRGLYFDKTPSANWALPWHQDTAIAVKARADVPGFEHWTLKKGIPHVIPPPEFLQDRLAVRLHLDDCDERNGALKMIPGTHLRTNIPEQELTVLAARVGVVTCSLRRGGVLVMNPLIAHASDRAESPRHRRVIHIEFSARSLPHPLEWADDVPLRHSSINEDRTA